MTNYAQHFSPRITPQSEKADERQVENGAGGYSFQVSPEQRLVRWLVLGSEGGSYYASERELTRENAKTVLECLSRDAEGAIRTIVDVSEGGRAPKNTPAIFALALAASHENARVRSLALAALPKVCRTAGHLFEFVGIIETGKFRGWGKGMRNAIEHWYASLSERDLCYQIAKYRQRGGWSHRDLFRLAHPRPFGDGKRGAIYRYLATGADGLGERAVGRDHGRKYGAVEALPEYLAAFEEFQRADAKRAIELIKQWKFTHEMVRSDLKNDPAVWDALVWDMPTTALVRNLAKMTAVGLIQPMSRVTTGIAARLSDPEKLKKARVHPIAMLSALLVYSQGKGERGKLTWEPSREIVDALDAGFYAAFGAVEPTGKRTLIALDVSGSMSGPPIAGVPGLSPRSGAAAMAMVTARVEKNWHCICFSQGHGGFAPAEARPGSGVIPFALSPRQRLDDVVSATDRMPFAGTDCSLPMLYALERRLDVDTFVVYTDSETWAGSIHPHEALRRYRDRTGIQAKLVVVGMVANNFTIADPADAGMLDVVGFDTATPNILAEFSKGW